MVKEGEKVIKGKIPCIIEVINMNIFVDYSKDGTVVKILSPSWKDVVAAKISLALQILINFMLISN